MLSNFLAFFMTSLEGVYIKVFGHKAFVHSLCISVPVCIKRLSVVLQHCREVCMHLATTRDPGEGLTIRVVILR